MLLDVINSTFEFGGAVMCLQNCRRLWRDRRVAGVDWRTIGFFAAWGWWNLIYYSQLDQWMSWTGGLLLTTCNTAWVLMAIRWRHAK